MQYLNKSLESISPSETKRSVSQKEVCAVVFFVYFWGSNEQHRGFVFHDSSGRKLET